MASIVEIGHGIRDLIAAIPAPYPSTGHIKVYAPDEIPAAFNEFPVAIILPGDLKYKADFKGDSDLVYRIIILISSADQPTSLSKIIPYMETAGDYSLNALFSLTAPQTLGGTCADAFLTSNKGLGSTTWGNANPYLSTEFELLVWT
jgi:hypothetical protein